MAGEQAKRERRVPVFWICTLIFLVLAVTFWVLIVRYVNTCMVEYEAAQPKYLLDEVVERVRSGELLEEMAFSGTRFEDAGTVKAVYLQKLDGRELSWRQAAGSYDAVSPVYEICAGDEAVATVTLSETSRRGLMLFLTLQEWEAGALVPIIDPPFSITVTAPDTCTVTVNGISVDEGDRTGNITELEQLQYAAAYVTVPVLVEYKLDGLYHQPDVRITDRDGRELPPDEATEQCVRVERFPVSEMPQDLADMALKNAKDYSNFFSADLAGSYGSTKPIRHLFPEGSYYLELADNYRKHDMWMYSAHATPTFSDEKVTNYVRYTEDLFSCDVYFDKKMFLTKIQQDRHDITNTRYFYVNLDGSWVIADMQQILDSDGG